MARSRRSLGILTPLFLLLSAAATWSFVWFYLSQEADARITEALATASEKGWTLTCGNRAIRGFPFRLEFDCGQPELVSETTSERLTVTAQRLLGVALIYNIKHVIVEVEGPTQVSTFKLGGERRALEVKTGSARASFELEDNGLAAVSFVATEALSQIPAFGLLHQSRGSAFATERAALHIRKIDATTHDIALKFDNTKLEGELSSALFESETLIAKTMDFVGQMKQSHALFHRSPAPGLAAWQAAGGEMHVRHLIVDAPALDIELSGVSTLDTWGRINGKFKGVFGKLNQLITDLKARGVLNDDGARLAAGAIGLLARPTKDGSKAELPVKISGGDVFLGPIKAMVLPALF